MSYPLLKALHVISMVAWMAAVFYLGRLLIYYAEAAKEDEPKRKILQDQFALMMKRLTFGIGHPAMLLTIVFGTWTMIKFGIIKQPWMHVKLTFVFGFIFYYFYLNKIRKSLLAGKVWSSLKLRFINEIATAFLIVIVVLAYLKDNMSHMNIALTFVISLLVLGVMVRLMRGKKDA